MLRSRRKGQIALLTLQQSPHSEHLSLPRLQGQSFLSLLQLQEERYQKIGPFSLLTAPLMSSCRHHRIIQLWHLVPINLPLVLKLFLPTIDRNSSCYWNPFFSGSGTISTSLVPVSLLEDLISLGAITTSMSYLREIGIVTFICCKENLKFSYWSTGPGACTTTRLGTFRAFRYYLHHTMTLV